MNFEWDEATELFYYMNVCYIII